METINYKDYEIKIQNYDYPENPREWYYTSNMVYYHRSYNLGDTKFIHDYARNWDENMVYYFAQNYESDIINWLIGYGENVGNEIEHDGFPTFLEEKHIKWVNLWIEHDVFVLPLYLYDHSGITMNTTAFNDRWDSGQVGFIYVRRGKAFTNYGIDATKEEILNSLRAEVKTFDHYIRGDVYSYVVHDKDGTEIDRCSGYYGTNHTESGLLNDAKESINYDIESGNAEERRKEREKEIEARELMELARLKAKYEK